MQEIDRLDAEKHPCNLFSKQCREEHSNWLNFVSRRRFGRLLPKLNSRRQIWGGAVAEMKNDGRPRGTPEDRMRIGLDPFETLPVLPARNDPRSPAPCPSGLAPFRKMRGICREWPLHASRENGVPKNGHTTRTQLPRNISRSCAMNAQR